MVPLCRTCWCTGNFVPWSSVDAKTLQRLTNDEACAWKKNPPMTTIRADATCNWDGSKTTHTHTKEVCDKNDKKFQVTHKRNLVIVSCPLGEDLTTCWLVQKLAHGLTSLRLIPLGMLLCGSPTCAELEKSTVYLWLHSCLRAKMQASLMCTAICRERIYLFTHLGDGCKQRITVVPAFVDLNNPFYSQVLLT